MDEMADLVNASAMSVLPDDKAKCRRERSVFNI